MSEKKISFTSDVLGSKNVDDFLQDAGASYDIDKTYDDFYGGANDKDYSESTYDENALNADNSVNTMTQIVEENTTSQDTTSQDTVEKILDKKTDELESDDIDRLRIERLKGDNDLNDKIVKKLEKPKPQEIVKKHENIADERLEQYLPEDPDPDLIYDIDDENGDSDITPFKYDLLKEKSPLDIWALVDTYFRDNPYHKTRHQLDSYDELLYSEKNGIKYIIKRENPFQIYKEMNPDNTFRYQIDIYYGESYDIENDKFIDTENIFYSAPTIYDNDMKYMFPNKARLNGYNYSMNIFVNIVVKITDNSINKSVYKNYSRVDIGRIPIMLHSKSCVLKDINHQKLKELGECPYDRGGYFIIKGKEKVVLSQEKRVDNIMYINESSDDNIHLQCLIKSTSTKGFQSSRTNAISFMNVRSDITGDYYDVIRVRILGIGIGENANFRIPLFVLFRALGVTTDREILCNIIYDNDNDTLKHKLLDVLYNTIKDGEPIYTQTEAYKFLSLQTKGKDNFNVLDILNNNFLPNYNNDNVSKTYYLGYSVRMLLLTHLGIVKTTDRDSYSYKRIDTAGTLLLELYRELWGKFKKNTSYKIDTEYKFNFEKSGNDIFNLINDTNYTSVFDNSILNDINKSFGASFGTGISAKQGIVQDLNRLSMLGALSHVRRLVTPLPAGSKVMGPRKLHNSQWGFVCPTESPDGANTGLYNHLSIISTISFNIDSSGIYDCLLEYDMSILNDIVVDDIYTHTKVFLNGNWIGLHDNPQFLLRLLKLLKYNSIINIYTSITWNTNKNEFYIFTDAGRIVRPIIRLNRDSNGNRYSDLIKGDLSLLKDWKTLVHGYMYKLKKDISVYDDNYYKDILDKIKKEHGDEYMTFLENNGAPLEYIDPLESEYAFICRDIYGINRDYTHCEIHSSLMLSPSSLQIPFPEHSQYPRNVFSCQQTKQAVGIYCSNYNTRFDTSSDVLYYPQRALVCTRYKKYNNVENLPNGMNIVVAIASYTGYNQEDSIIINRSSVERGMFNSMNFKSYQFDETMDDDGTVERFFNPKNLKDTLKNSKKNYDKLDDNGIVKEGEYVNYDDIIVAFTKTKILPDGKEINNVYGESVKFMTSGIVDRVIVTKNRDGLRKCKIRIFKNKIPDVGDKYASRCGQKGMCGMLLDQRDMPFTKDGIVPDLMINPHAIPSRMTINQFLEVVLGKSSVLCGRYGDATPFLNNRVEDYTNILEKMNYEKHADEVMYSGITGDQIHTSIFIGPTYYQRLKIMVADKMFSRSTGPIQNLTRQPAEGRGHQGGLRIGEMERDSILGHGVAGFLNESMMERSDKYNVQIDKYTGLISYDDKPLYEKNIIQIPYASKLLIQELQTMSIAPRLVTGVDIDNPVLFQHMDDIYSSKM